MKIPALLCALCFTVLTAHGQSPVDRLASALDSLGSLRFDGWSCSPDLKSFHTGGDPSAMNYDDSSWPRVHLRQSLTSDSVWLRRTFMMPSQVLGQPVRGKVRVLVSVDDYGYLWVNGEERGFFPWDGDFLLCDSARPGQVFTLAIKAMNTGGPLRLLRAELVLEQSAEMRQKILDLSLSLLVGQKLLGHDTYQSNARRRINPGLDRTSISREEKDSLQNLLLQAASSFQPELLRTGSIQDIDAAIETLREKLVPIGNFARRFTLTFVANAHIDAAWLWRERETRDVCRATFSSVFNIMRTKPGFSYTQSSALYYAWMETMYPDIFRGIQDRVRQGRWEIIGGMWIEPDCNMLSGESWMRQLLYGKKYFRDKFNVDVTTGWNPDSFGYHWNMPSMFRLAGIDAFITQKIGWNETNVFPHRVFWWEAPDGSRVLSYFPFDYVNSVEDPFKLVDWMRQFEANTGLRNMLVLFGVGDHGGGPSMAMIDRIERLKTLDVFPTIAYSTAQQYIDWLKSHKAETFPVWRDELYLEYHQGTFTTQGQTKQANRRCETLLTNAEKLAALAWMRGNPYPSEQLRAAWEGVMLNQFHDILPGSSIREVYVDAACDYASIERRGTHVSTSAMQHLVRTIDTRTKAGRIPVVVFNTLAWTRSDVVTVRLPAGDNKQYEVVDASGAVIVSQRVPVNEVETDLLFHARAVPALGYQTFFLRPVSSLPGAGTVAAFGATLGNRRFFVDTDTTTGWIRSILERRTNREVLSGPGNEIQLLEDKPAQWDAWNIGLTGVAFPSTFEGYTLVEFGPVRSILRLQRSYLKPGTKKDFPTENFPSSFFTQDIILYTELDRIDFRTEVDWWEDKTMVKVAFPLADRDTVVTSDIPHAVIQRPWNPQSPLEKGKTELPMLKWIDVSHGKHGTALLSRSTYGFDIANGALRLSLLRSPRWPDPTADRGRHEFHYALYPHDGDWRSADVIKKGYEYGTPLQAVLTTAHKGGLPSSSSFLGVEPAHCIVPAVKMAENGEGLIYQVVETMGKAGQVTLTFPRKVRSAELVSTMETPMGKVEVRGRSISFPIAAWSTRQVFVTFR